jgi:undecaprenyl-diphosphatase
MSWFDAIILGLVEGITEFLPVSSTGHLILTRDLLGLHGEEVNRSLIIIQGAAILAVCWEYRRRLVDTVFSLRSTPSARRFVFNLFLAFLPLAVLGLLFEAPLERLLFAPVPVALALVIGGILILWAERRKHREHILEVDDIKVSHAARIGFFQALALIPGTSRSAATILGGLLIGMSRRTATEFSFFIAIPTLLAATAYKLWEARAALEWSNAGPLALSAAVAFISALLSIRFLLKFVSRYSFAVFAWYRIFFGGLILAGYALGWIKW